MQNYTVFVPRLITKKEYFVPGHRACIGCGEALAVRLAAKAMGQNTIVVNATGCLEIIASQIPYTSWNIPWIHTLFENTAAVASGIEAGIKAMVRKGLREDKGTKVVAIAGDGGTADIGLQALSGAMERGHDFLYLCFDNEAYMNTGIQRSSATLLALPHHLPAGKVSIGQLSWKKDMPAIAPLTTPLCRHRLPQLPFDLMQKVKKGLETKGPAYIHILSVCPTGWRCAADLTIRIGRLAVKTGIFPLYEVENGIYKMNVDFPALRPVNDYMKLQGRFRHLTPEIIEQIQEKVTEKYEELRQKSAAAEAGE
jgi:pyruvate ferredoxin oxidoreductase beta subunit